MRRVVFAGGLLPAGVEAAATGGVQRVGLRGDLVGAIFHRVLGLDGDVGLVTVLVDRAALAAGGRGLDALDGTPVVDIKPYSPDIDCVK